MKGYRVSKDGLVIPGWIEEEDVRKLPDDFMEFPTPLPDMEEYSYKVIGSNSSVIQKIAPNQEELDAIYLLKKELSATDYQVTKCMEAQLMGNLLPYDIKALHSERQRIRDRINELEILINTKQ